MKKLWRSGLNWFLTFRVWYSSNMHACIACLDGIHVNLPMWLRFKYMHVSYIFDRYEDKTEWGDRVGWIYGSVTEDVVTGYRMHNRGWRLVYYITKRDAFRGSAPINLTDRLHQVLRWATGSVEIFFSRNNALLGSRRLKFLQRIAYLNVGIYPFTSVFLIVYCFLPALTFLRTIHCPDFKCHLLSLSTHHNNMLIALAILEVKWSGCWFYV